MSQLDKVEQQRATMQRLQKELSQVSLLVGTDKDGTMTRNKLLKARERFVEAEKKALMQMNDAPTSGPDAAEWSKMRASLREQRQEWDRLDRDVKARESANPISAVNAAGGDSRDGQQGYGGVGGGGGGAGGVKITDFKQVDTSELDTENAIQTERLQGIIEIEQNANEVRAMYQEFQSHVEGQQGALTTAEKNIDKSQDHVERGVKDLKSANKLQKSSRKKMFILLGIVGLIIIIVIVVVVLAKK